MVVITKLASELAERNWLGEIRMGVVNTPGDMGRGVP